MANATFQTDKLATVASGTVVAAYDRDGVLYQRFEQGLDYILFFYDGSGNIEYLCKHHTAGAGTDETDWIIKKFSYTGTNVTSTEILEGSVDGKGDLSWS